jgi:hypothetical protein
MLRTALAHLPQKEKFGTVASPPVWLGLGDFVACGQKTPGEPARSQLGWHPFDASLINVFDQIS